MSGGENRFVWLVVQRTREVHYHLGREAGTRAVKVLLVEFEPEGLSAVEETITHLSDTGIELERAGQLTSALERLSPGGIDLVLLDLTLPDSHGIVTFERAYAFSPDVPIVVLTELDDEELGLSTVRGGAQDYLIKGEVGADLLRRSIRYAAERHRLSSALRSLSLIDDLTGLYNRRGFADLGEQHLKLARRTGRAVILFYLDVDRLKTINDTLGHHVGDRALNRVADILRDTFRQSDIIARMGGDEFAVMALEASEQNQTELLARLREKVAEINLRRRESYSLSISVGTARFDGEGRARLDDLLAEADQVMYEEKRAKRAAHRTAE
jgi:two-component system cell cycle response regulator